MRDKEARRIEQAFLLRCREYPDVMERYVRFLSGSDAEEALCIRYLAATLPLSDCMEQSPESLLPGVRHALMLRSRYDWCGQLNELSFMEHVLYPRINTEDLAEARPLFYELLRERVEGLDAMAAALEVNYFCHEYAVYESSDERTASALTVFRNGSGRCGEESTFLVTALRAVGIASRQVYAPWWAHCDDNHAWVEFYAEGQWHFMGACEPEEVPDKGWFLSASSRAMLAHTRTFTGALREEDLACLYGEKRWRSCHTEGGVTVEHVTRRYARVRGFSVLVKDANGLPKEGELLTFSVLNMASFRRIAAMKTDKEGRVFIELGLGSVLVEGAGQQRLISVRELEEGSLITLQEEDPAGMGLPERFCMEAPSDEVIHEGRVTGEQKKAQARKTERGDVLRKERIKAFYDAERAKALCFGREPLYDAEEFASIEELLTKARGNFEAIYGFLSEAALSDGPIRLQLLKNLRSKDLRDISKAVLTDHLVQAAEYASDYAPEVFGPYVLSPWVLHERITPFRDVYLSLLDEKSQRRLQKHPEEAGEWVEKRLSPIPEKDAYEALTVSAEAAFAWGRALRKHIHLYAVQLLRSLGVPARLSAVSGKAEFLSKDGRFKAIFQSGDASFHLQAREAEVQEETFSLTRLEKTESVASESQMAAAVRGSIGERKTVSLPAWDDMMSTRAILPAGSYELIAARRMPNGSLEASYRTFTLKGKEKAEVTLHPPKTDLLGALPSLELPPFFVREKDDTINASALPGRSACALPGQRACALPGQRACALPGQRLSLWLFPRAGEEPTEHLLLELMKEKEALSEGSADIFFVLRREEELANETLRRTLSSLGTARVYYVQDEEDVETLSRRVYLDPWKRPLSILTEQKRSDTGETALFARYADSGYRVGLARLMVRILGALDPSFQEGTL